jgi:hypothetical protein
VKNLREAHTTYSNNIMFQRRKLLENLLRIWIK